MRTEGIYLLFFLLLGAFNTVFFQTNVVWSRKNNSRLNTETENTGVPKKRNASYEDSFEVILPSMNGQTFLTPKISTVDLFIYEAMKA